MHLHYGLIKVLRVEAYMEGTIRLVGVGEQRYPLGRLGDRHYDPFFEPCPQRVCSICSLYLMGTFCLVHAEMGEC